MNTNESKSNKSENARKQIGPSLQLLGARIGLSQLGKPCNKPIIITKTSKNIKNIMNTTCRLKAGFTKTV